GDLVRGRVVVTAVDKELLRVAEQLPLAVRLAHAGRSLVESGSLRGAHRVLMWMTAVGEKRIVVGGVVSGEWGAVWHRAPVRLPLTTHHSPLTTMKKVFDHIGIWASAPQTGEFWVEFSKVWVTNPRAHPQRIEYLRPLVKPDVPPEQAGLWHLWNRPHIAYR